MEIYRQGDILLKKLDQKPDISNLKKVTGNIILGYGEVTGHKHQIKQNATAYALSENDIEMFAVNGGDVPIFVDISANTKLEHEEHGAVALEPGWYTPVRQREYSPERLRYVQD